MATMLNGLMLVSTLYRIVQHSLCHWQNRSYYSIISCSSTEEPYYGSGSGSGAGIDDDDGDDDGEEGSGVNPIDYDYETGARGRGNVPGITKSINISTTHSSGAGSSGGTGSSSVGGSSGGYGPSVVLKNEKENKVRIDHSDSSNVNQKSNSNTNSGSGAVATIKLNSQMSLRRALFTYFLPIYLAWFGNIFSELL